MSFYRVEPNQKLKTNNFFFICQFMVLVIKKIYITLGDHVNDFPLKNKLS